MIYLVTANLTSFRSNLSQQLLRLMTNIVTATIMTIGSTLLQQLSRLYDPYSYSNYHVHMIYPVTATIASFRPNLSQQLLRLMINNATATITSIRPILLQQLSRLYDLSCYSLLRLYDLYGYSNYHAYMIYLVTATITSL